MAPASLSAPVAGVGLDLRRDEHRQLRERVIREVQRALGTDLDTDALVIKRRSLGALTGRGTWVRTEARPVRKLYGQPPDGFEAAALIDGVNKPRWYRGLSWHDSELEVMWRADESDYVADRPIITGGVLSAQPDISEAWWRDLGTSLDALAAATTTRVATVDTVPITQQRITASIQAAFGPRADTTVTAWGGIHGDLGWANLTGPRLAILDWEDFGRGPVGMDQARLWAASLVVPELRSRIESEFEPVFTGRTGRLSQLFVLAELLNAPLGHSGALREHAEAAAAALGLSPPSSAPIPSPSPQPGAPR